MGKQTRISAVLFPIKQDTEVDLPKGAQPLGVKRKSDTTASLFFLHDPQNTETVKKKLAILGGNRTIDMDLGDAPMLGSFSEHNGAIEYFVFLVKA